MKYTKHYYIDPVSLVPFNDARMGVGLNGKTHPPVPSLNVHFWISTKDGVDICYSTVNDDVDVSGYNGVTEITETEWFGDLEADFTSAKEFKKNQVFGLVQQIKSEVIDKWWHHSEISAAMTIKVTEAQNAIAAIDEEAARSVAPFLMIEADARNIPVKELAERVMSNYNGLIAGEALVSGHRGLICDQIAELTFNRESIETAKESYAALSNFDINQGFAQIREQLGL